MHGGMPPSPGGLFNTKGKGGDAMARDVRERGAGRQRAPLRRWERVVLGVLVLGVIVGVAVARLLV